MAYKCVECGHIFEEGEQARWEESRGEFWGMPSYETLSGCPICKGDYEETVRCSVCKSEHFEDELNGGVCDECIDEYRKNFDACYKLSLGETQEIRINELLASLFTVQDIEEILVEHIHTKWKDVDCSAFIDMDKEWFGEKIAEEVRKSENSKS